MTNSPQMQAQFSSTDNLYQANSVYNRFPIFSMAQTTSSNFLYNNCGMSPQQLLMYRNKQSTKVGNNACVSLGHDNDNDQKKSIFQLPFSTKSTTTLRRRNDTQNDSLDTQVINFVQENSAVSLNTSNTQQNPESSPYFKRDAVENEQPDSADFQVTATRMQYSAGIENHISRQRIDELKCYPSVPHCEVWCQPLQRRCESAASSKYGEKMISSDCSNTATTTGSRISELLLNEPKANPLYHSKCSAPAGVTVTATEVENDHMLPEQFSPDVFSCEVDEINENGETNGKNYCCSCLHALYLLVLVDTNCYLILKFALRLGSNTAYTAELQSSNDYIEMVKGVHDAVRASIQQAPILDQKVFEGHFKLTKDVPLHAFPHFRFLDVTSQR